MQIVPKKNSFTHYFNTARFRSSNIYQINALFHDMIHRLHLLYCITEETHFPILFTCSEGHLQQDTL